VATPRTSEQALFAREDPNDVPLLVLSATAPDDDLRRTLTAVNEDIATKSQGGINLGLDGADHMGLALDREHAEDVAQAVADFLEPLPAHQL
jgi:hypothetical protein